MEIIPRPKYLNRILPFVGKNLIKVIVGARRVGKTFILKMLIDHIKKHYPNSHIIYINKEEPEFKDITNSQELYSFVIANQKKDKQNFVFIDEIQEIESFEIALRYLLAKNFDIYISGSNAQMLSSDIATMLSGRYIEFTIYSLSYDEFLKFHNLPNNMDTFMKYIKYGGLPFLINLKLEDEIVYTYLQSIINTIILKDIIARFQIKEVDFLERLISFLANNIGSYLSVKKITDYLKSQKLRLSINTVNNYLFYLKQAFFIHQAKRFDIEGKRLLEINDKYYFSDLGLRHTLTRYNPKDINKVLENLVYNKLLTQGYKVYVGKLKDKEIDFVAVKGDQIKYFQVTTQLTDEKVIEREFGNLLSISDNFPKYVISADPLATGNYKGIEHKFILDFLAEE